MEETKPKALLRAYPFSCRTCDAIFATPEQLVAERLILHEMGMRAGSADRDAEKIETCPVCTHDL